MAKEDIHGLARRLHTPRVEQEARNVELYREGARCEEAFGKNDNLYDFAPVGLLAFDQHGRIVEVNQTGAALLGVEKSRLINKWFQLFVCQDSIPVFNTFCKTIFETGTRHTCEIKLLKNTKAPVYVRIEGLVSDVGQGIEKQCLAAIFDITEQKQASEDFRIAQAGVDMWALVRTAELATANEQLTMKISEIEQVQEALQKEYSFRNAIIAHAAEGLCVGHQTADYPYAQFTIWNRRMTEITGYDVEEINSLGCIKVLFPDPERRARALERMNKIWEGEDLLSEEWEITHADGGKRTVTISTSLIESGEGVVHLLALMHDVSDLRRSETALRERERYFRSLLLNLNEDILVIDRSHKIMDVNKDFMVTLGRSRQEVAGCHCYELLHGLEEPCNRFGHDCALEEVFEVGLPRRCSHEHIKADGAKVWVDILFSPLKDETGRTTHVISAIRDVTHEVELEKQLRQAQKMEALGTLAGGISHDFNNLLTPILIYTEMALYKLPQGSSMHHPLEEVLESARRAKELVKQILAFSRPGGEEKKPLEISHLVKETVKLLQSVLPRSIEICPAVSAIEKEGGSTILADPGQIHQVLMNLCTNASHAMRERGGVLRVGLADVNLHSKDLVRFPSLKPGSYVRLSVTDTGCGMDGTVLERIFDPFFTTKGPCEGTGLGLALVYGIVKGHGGAISVSSERGKGTTFQIFFPRIEEEEEIPQAAQKNRPVPGGTERILLVDDEEAVLGAMEEILSHLGYQVTAESESLEAMQVFRRQPDGFDLVITDQNMPHLMGVKLSEKIREIRADIPIVICTGYSHASAGISPEMCRAIGIRELLLKPVNSRQMAESVRRVLDGK